MRGNGYEPAAHPRSRAEYPEKIEQLPIRRPKSIHPIDGDRAKGGKGDHNHLRHPHIPKLAEEQGRKRRVVQSRPPG